MKFSRLLLASSVVSFALIQACSSDSTGDDNDKENAFKTREDPTFVEAAVNASHDFSNAVDATDPKKLVIPTSVGGATLGKIEVGTILAGDRDTKSTDLTTSKNPFGFLRKVVSVKQDGPNTVIETAPAELDEWLKNGDIYYDDPNSLFGGEVSTGGVTTKRLKILAETGGGSGSGSGAINQAIEGAEVTTDKGYKIKPLIKFSNGTMSMNARYDGYFRIRTFVGIPTQVSMKSLLTVDPVVGTDMEVGLQVVGSEGGLHLGVTPGITIAEKKYDLPGIVIPIAAPIPITVRFHPRIKCSLSGAGSASATVRAELRAHAAVGFEGSASLRNGFQTTNLSQQPTLSPTFQFKGGQVKAVVGAECQIVAVPEVLAFDALGISGEVGPYLGVDLNGCFNGNVQSQDFSGGFTVSEQHGLQVQFSARAQIPIVSVGQDFPLLTVHTAKSEEKFLIGNKDTCSIKNEDSCNGRTDGFYCRVDLPSAGFVCENGSIKSGKQCASTQKCVGVDGAGNIQCN